MTTKLFKVKKNSYNVSVVGRGSVNTYWFRKEDTEEERGGGEGEGGVKCPYMK